MAANSKFPPTVNTFKKAEKLYKSPKGAVFRRAGANKKLKRYAIICLVALKQVSWIVLVDLSPGSSAGSGSASGRYNEEQCWGKHQLLDDLFA